MYNPLKTYRQTSYIHPFVNTQQYFDVYGKKCLCSPDSCFHMHQYAKSSYNNEKIVDNNYYNNYPVKLPVKLDNVVINNNSLMDDYFKIVMIIDESGSMEAIKDKIIKSINDLITEQKQVKERPSTFTLVKFNNTVNRIVKNKNLNDVVTLKSSDYIPSGTTALYDAIGDTIEWFKNEKDVLMVIVTDGQNNSSKNYTKNQVSLMIEQKKKR